MKPASWAGLNQMAYVQGGEKSALWTDGAREYLATAPELRVSTALVDGDAR